MRKTTKRKHKRGPARTCPHCGGVLPPTLFRPPDKEQPELTERQRKVLRYIAQGFTCSQIASELGISTRTAEFHRRIVMEKLRLHSTAALTLYAASQGLV